MLIKIILVAMVGGLSFYFGRRKALKTARSLNEMNTLVASALKNSEGTRRSLLDAKGEIYSAIKETREYCNQIADAVNKLNAQKAKKDALSGIKGELEQRIQKLEENYEHDKKQLTEGFSQQLHEIKAFIGQLNDDLKRVDRELTEASAKKEEIARPSFSKVTERFYISKADLNRFFAKPLPRWISGPIQVVKMHEDKKWYAFDKGGRDISALAPADDSAAAKMYALGKKRRVKA